MSKFDTRRHQKDLLCTLLFVQAGVTPLNIAIARVQIAASQEKLFALKCIEAGLSTPEQEIGRLKAEMRPEDIAHVEHVMRGDT